MIQNAELKEEQKSHCEPQVTTGLTASTSFKKRKLQQKLLKRLQFEANQGESCLNNVNVVEGGVTGDAELPSSALQQGLLPPEMFTFDQQ